MAWFPHFAEYPDKRRNNSELSSDLSSFEIPGQWSMIWRRRSKVLGCHLILVERMLAPRKSQPRSTQHWNGSQVGKKPAFFLETPAEGNILKTLLPFLLLFALDRSEWKDKNQRTGSCGKDCPRCSNTLGGIPFLLSLGYKLVCFSSLWTIQLLPDLNIHCAVCSTAAFRGEIVGKASIPLSHWREIMLMFLLFMMRGEPTEALFCHEFKADCNSCEFWQECCVSNSLVQLWGRCRVTYSRCYLPRPKSLIKHNTRTLLNLRLSLGDLNLFFNVRRLTKLALFNILI